MGWLASVSWFLCDDAFISFRYVRNLLEGHGLVFNPGEYVEGYSNFLWVLELAAVWGILGIRPELAAPWLSVAFTAGTIAALLWWVARTPALRNRWLVAWLALGLVCSSATFAVWTSGGGLETRQFTCCLVVAVVCLGVHGSHRWGLLAASLSLGAAALTRPEGMMLAVLCFGWFAGQRVAAAGWRRLDWRELLYLAAPCVVLVAAHLLFRYAYYGEWLPNTYYAKHVRPWYESGFRYLWAAALETGLYLILPLAFVAMRERWRERRDGIYALVIICVVVHMAYLLRIGGDFFEYRPLDFYWPLLAVPAAVGMVHLGSRIAVALRRLVPAPSRFRLPGTRACAVALGIPVLFYAGAMQSLLLFEGVKTRAIHIELDEENAEWLLAAPGLPALVAISNDLRRQLAQNLIGRRVTRHEYFAELKKRTWPLYEEATRGVIPNDAVMDEGAIGIGPYYVPSLKVIDANGLTDATVARNPVTRPNHERKIAHDRFPPPGYLARRGVNFWLHPPAFSEADALASAVFALRLGPELWMPFNSSDYQWVMARFADQELRTRYGNIDEMAAGTPAGTLIISDTYDVYLNRNFLIYTKDSCRQDDTVPPFFLHLYPADGSDLPADRKQHGYDNHDFTLTPHDGRIGDRCFGVRVLPEYAVGRIETGQYLPGAGRLWEGAFYAENYVDQIVAGTSGWTLIISDAYDVYLNQGSLAFIKDSCHQDDMAPPFFLHLYPADEGDLPANRKQYGYDNHDFTLTTRGGPIGDRCFALHELPEYAVRRIETGQYLPGAGRLWEGAFSMEGGVSSYDGSVIAN